MRIFVNKVLLKTCFFKKRKEKEIVLVFLKRESVKTWLGP